MEKVKAKNVPEAIGPYSQAVKANNFVFTSGQIAIEPNTNKLVDGGIIAQTKQVLENIKTLLEAAGASLDNAVKVNVFLKDINDFHDMNSVYEKYFSNKPARATIQAAALPKDALIEIDVIAELKNNKIKN